jgi:hypothetical protein
VVVSEFVHPFTKEEEADGKRIDIGGKNNRTTIVSSSPSLGRLPIDIRLAWELGLAEGVPRLDENGKGVLGLGDRAGAAELHHVAHPEPVLQVVLLVFFVC